MKRLLPILIGFVVLLGMQQAQAWNPEHLKEFKETNTCPNCNLQGAKLQDANLKEADLRGVDLGEADLQGAKLFQANLKGAFFG